MGFDPALFIGEQPLDSSLLCNICLGVLETPSSSCASGGHVYCSDCLRQTKAAANQNIRSNCPECRAPMLASQILIRPLMNMINSKQVQCCNVTAVAKTQRLTEAGGAITTLGGRCQWRGTLSQYVASNHAQTCPHRMVQCTLAGCKERLVFSELEGHKAVCPHRLTKCPACKVSLKFNALTSHAADSCPERTFSCNYCSVKLKKKNLGLIKGRDPRRGDMLFLGAVTDEDVTGHYKVCPKIPLSCEFHPFGCSVKIFRQRMAAHHAEKAQHHAALVAKKTKAIEDSMAKMKRELQTKVDNAGKRIKKNFLWRVDREQLRGEGNKTISSKTFTVAGYVLQFNLTTVGQVVSVGLCVVSAPNHDVILLEDLVFESSVCVDGENCEEVFFTSDGFLEDELENGVGDGPGGRVFGGQMTWYDEEEDATLSAAKDQLLGCTCESDSHVEITVKFDLIIPLQELV